MQGKVGDRILVETERAGQRDRSGEIVEVLEASTGIRYRVRWDDGHESVIQPAAGSARIVAATKRRT